MGNERVKNYRAVYYERVSTIDSSQDESMENQRRLLESYCKRHLDVELVAEFSERISGKSDERPQFQAMLSRIKEGDIDLVLVKDLKRLSRSQEVSAELRNLAKDYRFQFVLLGTGQVYDPNASENRMLYGFESLINEEVVYRQSEYGRLAHRQKMEARRLNRNNITFGYSWSGEKMDIIINEDQAELVRDVFELYVFKDYGTQEIRKYLAEKRVYRTNETIRKWLSETAYIGIFHMNKKGSELGVGKGRHTHRYTNPKEEWVSVNRPDLKIVDPELFNLAQEIKKYRAGKYPPDKNGNSQGRFRGTHLFSGKIFCAECGRPFVHTYADRNRSVGIYRVSRSKRVGEIFTVCSNTENHRVYEEDIIAIIVRSINTVTENRDGIIKDLIETIRKVLNEAVHDTSKEECIAKEIAQLRKKQKLLKEKYLRSSGQLSLDLESDYNSISETLLKKETELEKHRQSEKKQIDTGRIIEERIMVMGNELKAHSKVLDQDISKKTLERILKKVIVHQNGAIDIIFVSGKIQYQATDSMNEGNPNKGSSFHFKEGNSKYDIRTLKRIYMIRDVFERAAMNIRPESARLFLLNYEYISERMRKNGRIIQYNVSAYMEVVM